MSVIPSDLPGPVEEPTGPTEGALIASLPESPGSVVLADTPESDGSIVFNSEIAPPPAVAGTGEVILAIIAPWNTNNFDPSLAGCPVISDRGTAVADNLADQVISIGATNGVTIVKR